MIPPTMTIKIHNSKAHNDEVVAAALLLAYWDSTAVIVRTNTIHELDYQDPYVAVVDVGRTHDPDLMCFDHHQRGRDEAPECAFSLVAKHYGIAEKLSKYEGWFNTWRNIDATGPYNAANIDGIELDAALNWIPPVSEMFLEWFSEQDIIEPFTQAHDMLLKWGQKLRKKLEAYEAFEKKAAEKKLVVGDDHKVVYDMFDFGEEAFQFSDWFLKDHPETSALVRINSRDPSGEECGITRITHADGTFDFDFGRVTSPTSFKHSNGFYMTGDHALVRKFLKEGRLV